MIRSAIFDFDETMVLLEEQHTWASSELCREMGDDYDALPEPFRNRSGARVIDDVREMREWFGWSESLETLFARREELFDAACSRGPVMTRSRVPEAVEFLLDRGLSLGIASSGVRQSIEKILEGLGLRASFSVIVGGEDVDHGKPDPEPYALAVRRLGRAASECVVFEDSAVGVQSALSAGCRCVAVRNPEARTFQDLSAAELIVESFEELDLDVVITGRSSVE